MNYKNIYDSLISRGINRVIEGYSEKHHIVPRCMGGTNDPSNLVSLTPEEHFVAHQLLVKIYAGEDKLVFALAVMSGKNNNKMFGWHRRKLAEAQRTAKTGVKLGPQSEAHRAAIGDANRGEKNGMFGKKASEETKAKLKGRVPWNKGTKGLQQAWNKGVETGAKTEGCFEKGRVPWNKGLSKDTDPRVASYGKSRSASNKSKKG